MNLLLGNKNIMENIFATEIKELKNDIIYL
jgi:hypothetical protein